MTVHDHSRQSDDYRRIAKAIRYIESHFQQRPSLDRLAEHVHLSRFHFNRLFKRWAGISPMQFIQSLTLEDTKQRLRQSRSLLGVALDAGLSGAGRLHDLFVTFEAMTPGEYKRMGAGLAIRYGVSASPFGSCLIAVTGRGICHLGFVDRDSDAPVLDQLRLAWPNASFEEDPDAIQPIARRIFDVPSQGRSRPFHLLLKGTNFQISVWRALMAIPSGRLLSYQDIAAYVGKPAASRAVGNTVAINPVGYLIPCHRVIAQTGVIHRYRWGTVRKKAMVGWEAARGATFDRERDAFEK
jgi:AraC family transcriptional regulator of adaptative response/methylated-DNA-[protein]-cysteine methyltransferase